MADRPSVATSESPLRLSRFSNFVSQHYRHRLAELLPSLGLGLSDYPILLYLWHHRASLPNGASQTQLSRCTLADKAAIARSVRKLVDLGYAAVSADPTNLSRNIVSLTEAGTEAAQKVDGWVFTWEEEVMSDLDAAERQEFLSVFNKVFSRLRIDQPA